MPQARFGFPNGFLWGTATSSHQVEGNNRNNTWYAWEQGRRTRGGRAVIRQRLRLVGRPLAKRFRPGSRSRPQRAAFVDRVEPAAAHAGPLG